MSLALSELYALIEAREWSEVTDIITSAPALASQKFDNPFGDLPLHAVMQYEAPLELLQCTFKAFPEAAMIKENSGCVPLNYVNSKTPLLFVQELLALYPQAAQERDNDGQLPLVFCVRYKSLSYEVLSCILKAHPEAAYSKGKHGRVVLFTFPRVPTAFLIDLVALYPQGVNEKDEDGNYAFHVALFDKKTHTDSLLLLLKANPEAARVVGVKLMSDLYPLEEEERDLFMPLQYAVQEGLPFQLVVELLDAHPQGAQEKDQDENLSLHIEAAKGDNASLEVINALLDAFPLAACEKNGDGELAYHLASENGASSAVLEALLKVYPQAIDVQSLIPVRRSLWLACKEGQIETVRSILNEHALQASLFINSSKLSFTVPLVPQMEKRTEICETAVSICCREGHVELLAFLLTNNICGANANLKSAKFAAPVEVAIKEGKSECLEVLLAHGKIERLEKALECAVLGGNLKMVSLLLANGADATKGTLIASAVRRGKEMVALLLSAGADPNKKRQDGHFALTTAAIQGCADVVQVLVEGGACPDGDEDFTPLYFAASQGHLTVVVALLENGANPNRLFGKSTFLNTAAEDGHVEVVAALLAYGADANLCDEKGASPLLCCASSGNEKCAHLLLKSGADVSKANNDGHTPLYIASRRGDSNMLLLLLSKNASADATNEDLSPILVAAQRGHENVVRELVMYSSREDTPKALVVAMERGHAKIVKTLEKHHLKLVESKLYALKYAVIRNNSQEVASLLAHWSEIDSFDPWDSEITPLMLAASLNRLEIFEMLLAAGAKVSTVAYYDPYCNRMATNYAAREGHVAILKRCVELGADIKKVITNHNISAISEACQFGHTACVSYLLSLPCNIDVSKPDGHGDTPLMLYLRGNPKPDSELLLSLLERDLPCSIEDGTPSASSHGYSWAYVLDSNNLREQQCLALVERLLTKHAHLIKPLAFSTDKYGRTVTNITHKLVKSWIDERLFFCGRYELKQGPPIHRSATAVVIAALDHSVANTYKQASQGRTTLDFAAFCFAVASLGLYSESIKSEEKLKESFDFVDKDRDGSISTHDFVSFCTTIFGASCAVVLKLMANEDQWKREIEVREVGQLDGRFVVGLLEKMGPTHERFIADVSHAKMSDGSSLGEYRYCIVMPAADRSLDEIYKKERPGLERIRVIAKELAQAVQECHDKGITHGDLKMLNALRIDGSIKLIDMDASAVLDRDYAGAKFSSGILPPDIFFELKTKEQEDAYLGYWSKEREANGELWQTKLKPVSYKKGMGKPRTFVVKTFRTSLEVVEGEGEVPELEGLPYVPMRASTSLDMWSFGLILFTLCTGKPLVPVNRDDDLESQEAFLKAATWTDAELDVHIRQSTNTSTPAAVDLLTKLLHVKPGDRMQSMTEVLAHPFITGVSADSELLRSMAATLTEVNERTKAIDARTSAILDKTISIENIAVKTHAQLLKTEKVLLRGIYDAADCQVPSCFLIRNTLIGQDEDKEDEEEKRDSSVVVLNADVKAQQEAASSWFSFMTDAASAVADFVEDPKAAICGSLKSKFQGKTLYLYLVDEYTMKPVVDTKGIYPLRIQVASKEDEKLVADVMPLMKVGLKAMTMLNGVAGMARALGYPAPVLSAEAIGDAKGFVGGLDQKSSVAEFDMLQGVAGKVGEGAGEEEKKKVRGQAIRELANFFSKEDKDNYFSGLMRVAAKDGSCCWCSQESADEMQRLGEEEFENGEQEQQTTAVAAATATATTTTAAQQELQRQLQQQQKQQQQQQQQQALVSTSSTTSHRELHQHHVLTTTTTSTSSAAAAATTATSIAYQHGNNSTALLLLEQQLRFEEEKNKQQQQHLSAEREEKARLLQIIEKFASANAGDNGSSSRSGGGGGGGSTDVQKERGCVFLSFI